MLEPLLPVAVRQGRPPVHPRRRSVDGWELAALRIGLTLCGVTLTVLAYAVFAWRLRDRSADVRLLQHDREH
ncbi:hypothetical protein ACWCP6_31505 [Streptomyces sp. NPDC002004]